MATRKEFQEWLNRFPEDTIIEVAIQQPAALYQSYGPVEFISPKLIDKDSGEGWDYTDFTDNPFVNINADNYNKSYLQLGESD